MKRPLIIGVDQEYDQFIWQMLNERVSDVTLEQYQNTFERSNTMDVDVTGRTVLLMGITTRAMFPKDIIHPTLGFRWVPHPTDKWYREHPINCIMVGMILEEMYDVFHRRP